MSDNYADVPGEAKDLIERFIDLEVQHQAMLAYSYVEDDYDWTDEEKLRQLNQYSDEYRDEIASWFSDLNDRFDELANVPDPEPFRTQADKLADALVVLAGPSGHTDVSSGTEYGPAKAFQHLTGMPSLLQDWNGIAADAFKSLFLPPMERVVHHEFECVVSLRSPLLAEAMLWEKARKDVSDLIDEANSALDDYEGGKDSADAVLALGIIGAIVAVAAVPFTGGTSAALYWAMAGSAISVAGAVVGYPNEPKKELDIKGDSPAEIAQSLREAIADVKIQWIEDEAFIRDKMWILQDTVNGYTGEKDSPPMPRGYPYYSTGHHYSEDTVHEFSMPRPALASSGPGNVTDDNHFGTPDA